ncbi:MAG: hypothetical protein AB1779_00820 [Candidatus Thermoplasmatota archaeon]
MEGMEIKGKCKCGNPILTSTYLLDTDGSRICYDCYIKKWREIYEAST